MKIFKKNGWILIVYRQVTMCIFNTFIKFAFIFIIVLMKRIMRRNHIKQNEY